jgi:hypothetical protein
VTLHSEDQIVWYLSINGSPIGPMTIGNLKERLWSSAQWETEDVWREGYPRIIFSLNPQSAGFASSNGCGRCRRKGERPPGKHIESQVCSSEAVPI